MFSTFTRDWACKGVQLGSKSKLRLYKQTLCVKVPEKIYDLKLTQKQIAKQVIKEMELPYLSEFSLAQLKEITFSKKLW